MQEGCGAENRLSGSTLPLLWLSSTEEGETGNGSEEGKSCLTGIEWRMGIEFEVEVEIGVEGTESFLKTVYESIKEEQEEGKGEVNTVLRDGLLYVSIGGSSDEIARLRAVVNTWLRLLKIAEDMVEVIKEMSEQKGVGVITKEP